MKAVQITGWCARFIREQIQPGDICIDATMGNGNDTLLLSSLCGKDGHVFAFDIQEAALINTRKRLMEADAPQNYTLLLESHTNIEHYVDPGTVSCITFNLGYLPGGDHTKVTHADTSIAALSKSLDLLQKGGLISLCIYSGGDSGFEERNAVLAWLKELNPHKYLVIRSDYYNRPNNPPIPVLIIRQ